MKSIKIALVSICFLFIPVLTFAQETRTIETRIADLLARMPAQNITLTNSLVEEMLNIGDTCFRIVCDQVIPAGTGDDTKARFAVESLSRYLSRGAREADRLKWEKNCISYIQKSTDNSIVDFFMKQLQMVGGGESAVAVKPFLNNRDLCSSAVGVLLSVGGKEAEAVLSESLANPGLKCAAAVMNVLANMGSDTAVNEYIKWAASKDLNIRASALNALAVTGSPDARTILLRSAADVKYIWEGSGATSSLLTYARVIGLKGDKKGMEKICKLLMSKCNDKTNIQTKIAALEIYTEFYGIDAMPLLIKAVSHPNLKYRNAALDISVSIPGGEAARQWIAYYPRASAEVRPGIIATLGLMGDKSAVPLVSEALSDPDENIRREALRAITKIEGKNALPRIVEYIRTFTSQDDQKAAKESVETIAGDNEMALLLPLLKDKNPAPVVTCIEILAHNGDPAHFMDVYMLAGSADNSVRKASLSSLASLASLSDQEALIRLLGELSDNSEIESVRSAIAVAANQEPVAARRSDLILKYLSGDILGKGASEFKKFKMNLIPVLSKTGGSEALALVLKEFENGDHDVREICFKTLTGWSDYTASYALYEICASGNKSFEGQAFDGYVRQVMNSGLPDEQKLLMVRKIMPYALSVERKNKILTETGKINTYQALFLVAGYLDDPGTSAAAAKAAMLIALPSVSGGAGLYGNLVKDILLRAQPAITGQESDYDKEMITKYIAGMSKDPGFQPMFNGKDLSGWQGLVDDPVKRSRMSKTELERKQAEADMMIPSNWSVRDGCIVFSGEGSNLCSVKQYGDFELLVDWRITKGGDSGIYLRGSPQVQIWDTSRTDVGAQVGSGGLYNNEKNPSKPLKVADNPVGDWNTFRILMIGENVTVWLNGELVVDNTVLENYWNRKIPIFAKGPVELKAHGTDLAFRDIYIREISDKDYNLTDDERAEGFEALFNGRNLDNWTGNKTSYVVENGCIVVKPGDGSGGNLYTDREFSDFIFRFEFQLTPGANNGLGIRTPLTGDAAYVGMEIQILDNTAPVYANLQSYQYHGSVYGVIPARREYLKPVGEWNYEEVRITGTKITVTLNGALLVDGDIAGPRDNGTIDHQDHPGLKNTKGYIGFLGHGSELKFRNIRIKDLSR